MLVLAVHTVEAATAKVPFSMIVLNDLIKRRATPEDARVRMVIPSGGLQVRGLGPRLGRWAAPRAAAGGGCPPLVPRPAACRAPGRLLP